MARDVGDLVAAVNPAVGIDEVTVSHRVFGILLLRGAGNFVFGPDRAVDIAQQMEWEVLRFRERQVLGRCVERSAQDDGIELFEPMGAVTQALTLDRSTTCRRFGVPPQQHPLAAKILKVNIRTVFIGQFEVGRNRVQRQHRQSLADLDGRCHCERDDPVGLTRREMRAGKRTEAPVRRTPAPRADRDPHGPCRSRRNS